MKIYWKSIFSKIILHIILLEVSILSSHMGIGQWMCENQMHSYSSYTKIYVTKCWELKLNVNDVWGILAL
jgi:hypothetical protein